MSFHMIGSMALAILITLTALSNNSVHRIVYAVSAIIVSFVTLVVYGIEYDKMHMEAWKKKEARLRKELKK